MKESKVQDQQQNDQEESKTANGLEISALFGLEQNLEEQEQPLVIQKHITDREEEGPANQDTMQNVKTQKDKVDQFQLKKSVVIVEENSEYSSNSSSESLELPQKSQSSAQKIGVQVDQLSNGGFSMLKEKFHMKHVEQMEIATVNTKQRRQSFAVDVAQNKFLLQNLQKNHSTLPINSMNSEQKNALEKRTQPKGFQGDMEVFDFDLKIEDSEEYEDRLNKKKELGDLNLPRISRTTFLQERQNSQLITNDLFGIFKKHDYESLDIDETSVLSKELFGSSAPLAQDSHHFELFNNLVFHRMIFTKYDIMHLIFSNKNNVVIILMRKDESELVVRMYFLDTKKFVQFGVKGEEIKSLKIEQSQDGNLFCLVVEAEGEFRAIIFNEEMIVSDLKLSKLLDLAKQETVEHKEKPQICCCFIDESRLFFVLNHRETNRLVYFFYLLKEIQIVKKQYLQMTPQYTFPFQAVYIEGTEFCHFFLRQGKHYQVKLDAPEECEIQQLPIKSLTQVIFPHENLIIGRFSIQIVFFKREDKKWLKFFKIEQGGNLNYNLTDHTLTVSNENEIMIYLIEQDSLMPQLKTIFANNDECHNMIFTPKGHQTITYSQSMPQFNIYCRKYNHTFMAEISNPCQNWTIFLALNKVNQFMAFQNNHTLQFFSQETFANVGSINLLSLRNLKNEDITSLSGMKVLHATTNCSESLIGLVLGHEEKHTKDMHQLLIFSRNHKKIWTNSDVFTFPTKFSHFSQKFKFREGKPYEITITSAHEIVALNYRTGSVSQLYQFSECLNGQTNFQIFNTLETAVVLTTKFDVVLVNLKKKNLVEIDNILQLEDVLHVSFMEDMFYVLANKRESKLGIYLVCFKPDNFEEHKFILKIENKLQIGDAQIHKYSHGGDYQKLVLTFKSIHMNLFNVYVIDHKSLKIELKFYFHHLWEFKITSLLIRNCNLVIFTQSTANMISLFTNKVIMKAFGNYYQQMLHSLSSPKDMFLEDSNCLDFNFSKKETIITLQQKAGSEEAFVDIFKVRVHKSQMRELLLINNIIRCQREKNIINLVRGQPSTDMFFKSFLELDRKNMIFIIAPNSKCVKGLFERNGSSNYEFDEKFPVIYKVKCSNVQKILYHDLFTQGKKSLHRIKVINQHEHEQSAIDIALKENEFVSLQLLLKHVVHHQNNYVSSYLFKSNLIKIIHKGLDVKHLLDSKIFIFKTKFDWPVIHSDCTEMAVPFNGNFFDIEKNYDELFGSQLQNFEKVNLKYSQNPVKIYKITYRVNVLTGTQSVGQKSLMKACGETNELEIFETKVLKDLIDFKWKNYGKAVHYTSFVVHSLYQVCFTMAANQVYMYKYKRVDVPTLTLMSGCLIYQFIYDTRQLINSGPSEYFSDKWNWTDLVHIYGGIANLYFQIFLEDPQTHKLCKLLLMLLTFVLLIKTFFYMRLLPKMAHLVTMMSRVFSDIQGFMMFFFILVWTISLLFTIIGLGQMNDNFETVRDIKKFKQTSFAGKEYAYLPQFLHNWLNVLRISLGDFDFGQSTELDEFNNVMFWWSWLLMVIITCIIFMNFIIAEVSNSYNNVNEKVNGVIQQEKAQLIQESECMLTQSILQDQTKFPKYIVTREVKD